MSEFIPKKWLNVDEIAAYIGVKTSTVYSYIGRRLIPHHKAPGSSLVKFKIDEIDEWLEAGRVETIDEHLGGGHGKSKTKAR